MDSELELKLKSEKDQVENEQLKVGDKIMIAIEHYVQAQEGNVGNFGTVLEIDDTNRKVLYEDSYGIRWSIDKWHCIKDTIDTKEVKKEDTPVIKDVKEYIDIIETSVASEDTEEAVTAENLIGIFLANGDIKERMINEVTIRRALLKYIEFCQEEIEQLEENASELEAEEILKMQSVANDKARAINDILDQEGVFEEIAELDDYKNFGSDEDLEMYGIRFVSEDEYAEYQEADRIGTTTKKGEIPSCLIDMTKRAENGKYNDIIGRENEIDTITEVLARKEIRNPLLVGRPGCGKTAVIEEIVKRAQKGEIPYLKDKHFYELRMNDLVAGTMYRGQLEEKLQSVMHVLEDDPNVVLFIDEIHMIVKAGSTANDSNDVSNALKPYLTSEISIVGATTFDEYKATIESDGALSRRFETVMIDEKSKEEVKEIVDKIKGRFENFHNVEISKDMIDQIVESVAAKKGSNSVISRTLSAVDTICTKMKVKGIDENAAFDKWSTEFVSEVNRKNDGGVRGKVGFNPGADEPRKTNRLTSPSRTRIGVVNESIDTNVNAVVVEKEDNITLEFNNEIVVSDFIREEIKNADEETIMAIDSMITEMATEASDLETEIDNTSDDLDRISIEM